MKTPSISLSAVTLCEEYGEYTQARLDADESCREPAALFRGAQDRLKGAIGAHRGAKFDYMGAGVDLEQAREGLAFAVRSFHRTIAVRVRNRWKAPLYRGYFPRGSRYVLYVPIHEHLQRVRTLVAELETEPDGDLRAHLEPLRAAADRFGSALRARDAAAVAQARTFELLRIEKSHWLAMYRCVYFELSRIFVATPSRAETFFLHPERNRRRRQEDAGDNATAGQSEVPARVDGAGTGTGAGAGTGIGVETGTGESGSEEGG